MRVLLASTGEKGHLNPLIPAAQELMRRGHEVGWLCLPVPAPEIARLGVVAVTADLPPGPELITGGAALAELVDDAERLRAWIRTLLLDAVPLQIPALMAAVGGFRPDVVGTDPMLYGVILAAHRLGIPWLGISSSLNPVAPRLGTALQETLVALDPLRRALFQGEGLEIGFAVADALSPWGTTVFATEAFVGAPPQGVHLVGPSIPSGPRGDEPEFPWERVRPPYVYVSFGSQISWQPRAYEALVEATDGALVIVAGDLVGTDWARSLPDRVVAVRYAPQHRLLEGASVFVTHGGANSVMEALYHGTPIAISPVCNDQPQQAWFLQNTGRGEVIDVRSSSPDAIRAALDRARRCPTEALRDSYRSRDGARGVADLLERT